MKNLIIVLSAIILFGTTSFTANGQKTKRPKDPGEGHEKVSPKLFINADFFKKYNLDPGTMANERIHDWASMDKENKYAVVNDIRWEFDNAEEAMNYQKKNLVTNSQKGDELHPKISIPGASEVHIYKENDYITNTNKDLGINTMEYGYLFVIDKVVAKVWVKVNGNVTVEEASLFAKEAAKAIQAAGK